MSRKILILSSTSEIAESLAQLYLNKSDTLMLHARSRDKLDALFDRLKELEPEANLTRLPLFDLVSPRYATEPNIAPGMEAQYQKWFDDVVYEYGLPHYLIIASGGVGTQDSAILTLNTLAPMLACEQYLRKFKEHGDNPKYVGKVFRIVYMGSAAADLQYSTYCRAKRFMEIYMKQLKVDSPTLFIQYAKIGPVDTKMLTSFRHKLWTNKPSNPFMRFINRVIIRSIELLKVTPDDAAKSMYYSIEKNRRNFYAPNFMGYVIFFIRPFLWLAHTLFL